MQVERVSEQLRCILVFLCNERMNEKKGSCKVSESMRLCITVRIKWRQYQRVKYQRVWWYEAAITVRIVGVYEFVRVCKSV